MSVSGILSSSVSNYQLSSTYQPTRSKFQQLGQDLASGNLSAAQSDFAILEQAFTKPGAASTASHSNPIAQEFQQLATDLKSGNLSAAQQDYATIQQDLRIMHGGHTHNHHLLQILNPPDQSAPGAANGTQGQSPSVSFLA